MAHQLPGATVIGVEKTSAFPQWFAVCFGMVLGVMPQTGLAQSAAADAEAQKAAYIHGIKCYVADGVAVSDARYNPSGRNSDALRDKAKKSYDVIWYMGRATGKSDDLIREDIDSYQTMLSGSFVRDDAFFQRVRGDCLKLGLM